MFNYNNNQYGQNQIPRYNTQLAYGQVPQQTIQQSIQPIPTYTSQPVQPINTVIQGLQGKSVDSIDVVKAMDIPLDGSISYFPLVDGSSIVTKQLMQDGTSRMIVYKPAETTPKANTIESKDIYVTEEQLEEKLKTFNNEELKQEIEKLKKQIKDLTSNSKK